MSLWNGKVSFEDQYVDDIFPLVRSAKLKINKKEIDTPLLWLGHLPSLEPHLWNHFDVETVMVSAYEIIRNRRVYNEVCEKGIHKYLGFDGLIIMDSGGFSFQKKDELDVDPEDILELYEMSKPDLGVVLDHPLNPLEDEMKNKERWLKTLQNSDLMLKNSKIPLIPVVHGYSLKDLKKSCDDIKNIHENPPIIGLGSIVPLIFKCRGSKKFKNSVNFIIDSVRMVRKEFPDSLLHVFGIGSTKSMHLMYSLGVDSLDSMGWRLKAAYGCIQLPGVGDRYPVNKNNGRPSLTESDKKLLGVCECPICKDRSLEERIRLLDSDFKSRAIHNAWVFMCERDLYHQKLLDGRCFDFCNERLKTGFFSKHFSYALQEVVHQRLDSVNI